jgi:hypothetical protein
MVLLFHTCVVSNLLLVTPGDTQLGDELEMRQRRLYIVGLRVTWEMNGYMHWEHIGSASPMRNKITSCDLGSGVMGSWDSF